MDIMYHNVSFLKGGNSEDNLDEKQHYGYCSLSVAERATK